MGADGQPVTSCTSRGAGEDTASDHHPEEPPTAAPDTGAPLGEELKRSEGVIVPVDPGVDLDMVQPPPDTGGAATMPVIPPPGTPGGDPNVRPQ